MMKVVFNGAGKDVDLRSLFSKIIYPKGVSI
jgi:hypothetical protein